MIVKRNNNSSRIFDVFSRGNSKYRINRILCKLMYIFFIISVFSSLLFYTSLTGSNKIILTNKLKQNFQEITNVKGYTTSIYSYINTQLKDVDSVYIDIKHLELQKIENMRLNALSGSKKFDYVPAKIRYNNNKMKVKLRLKGDRKIHFEDIDSTSYRIKIKGDNTLFGMKVFSIQKPKARNYIHEWIYLKMMQKEGLIAPQYKFIKLNLNGKDLGLYVIEEHYDKHLIERYGHREGPIIRFDEIGMFEKNGKKKPIDSVSYYKKMPITPFQYSKWTKSENLFLTKKAVHLLDGYRKGIYKVSDVFDVEKLALFYAVVDITGSHHGSIPKSLRFYYNPVTSKLEPIPFDGHLGMLKEPMTSLEFAIIKPEQWMIVDWGDWFVELFNDPERIDPVFISAYIKALEKVSSPDYLSHFFELFADEIEQYNSLIYSTFALKDNMIDYGPSLYHFSKQIYYNRQKYIRSRLYPLDTLEFIKSAFIQKKTQSEIQVSLEKGKSKFPITIHNLTCGNFLYKPLQLEKNIFSELNVKPKKQILHFSPIQDMKDFVDDCEYNLIYSVQGSKHIDKFRVYPWKRFKHDSSRLDISRHSGNVDKFNFIEIDKTNKELKVKLGEHIISESLIIPPGFTFIMQKGTTLNLTNNAMIYSLSPVNFTGTSSKPITITSTDYTAQGLAVLKAKKKSNLEFVTFSKLLNPEINDWKLSGAITFYESPVELSNVTIKETKSEDALNIVRSKFKINNLTIQNVTSDAVDIDFSEGDFSNGIFSNVGNDGIDVSGTNLVVKNVSFNSIGDKCISAGENSIVNLDGALINHCELAVVSKDSSQINIKHVNIQNSQVSFLAFQKKPEFGPANISAQIVNHDVKGVFKMIEQGSSFTLDGIKFSGDLKDVKSSLYGKVYGKKSG